MRRAAGTAVLAGCLLAGAPGAARAAQGPAAGRVADTTARIGPGGAFWRSLLLPGWGQAATGRHVTGAAFTVWEGVTLMMTLKTKAELRHIRASGALHTATKEQEVQDWTVLLIFNHLFAGAEAYVSAHLQDFPRDLKIRATPRGFVVSFPLPRP